jgi:hypothetical protein
MTAVTTENRIGRASGILSHPADSRRNVLQNALSPSGVNGKPHSGHPVTCNFESVYYNWINIC